MSNNSEAPYAVYAIGSSIIKGDWDGPERSDNGERIEQIRQILLTEGVSIDAVVSISEVSATSVERVPFRTAHALLGQDIEILPIRDQPEITNPALLAALSADHIQENLTGKKSILLVGEFIPLETAIHPYTAFMRRADHVDYDLGMSLLNRDKEKLGEVVMAKFVSDQPWENYAGFSAARMDWIEFAPGGRLFIPQHPTASERLAARNMRRVAGTPASLKF